MSRLPSMPELTVSRNLDRAKRRLPDRHGDPQRLVGADPNLRNKRQGRMFADRTLTRWVSDWAGLVDDRSSKSSGDYSWPWSDAGDDAEAIFQQIVPEHLRPPEADGRLALRKRQDKGRNWWEIAGPCAYWE